MLATRNIGMKGIRRDSSKDLSPSIVKLNGAKDVFYWHEDAKEKVFFIPIGQREVLKASKVDGN